MTRVAQLAQQTLTLNNVLNTQERVQDAEIQIATGKKSLDYAGIFRDATRLVSIESTQKRTSQFIQNNTIIESRLERMDTAVSTVFDAVSELRQTLIQAISDSSSGEVRLAEVAQNLLDVVTGQLNAKDNGRYLFSGSKTNVQPVTVPVPDPTTFGVPEANYYNGDTIQLTTRIDETTTITYGITADRTAFQQAIAALKGAIEGDNTNNTNLMNTSLGLAESAIASLAGFRTEIGSDLKTIELANRRNNDLVVFIEGRISDIENVDVPATVAQLASEQTILQASFLTLVRVASLTLVDFLN